MYSALILQFNISLGALIGLVLDFLMGDPVRIPHPVVLMGKGISRLEGVLRRRFPETGR